MTTAAATGKRVLLIQETYLPLIGGAEFHVHYLAANLLAQGHSVEIITGLAGDTSGHTDICKVTRYPHAVGRRGFPWLLVWLVRFWRLFPRFDVIHVHHPSFLAFAATLVAMVTGHKLVVTLHGLGALDSSVGNCPLRRLYRFVSLKLAGRIIATSDEMRDVAIRFAPPERIVQITNGVATNLFQPPAGRDFAGTAELLRLVTLRRLNPKNGVHFAIDALGAAGNRLKAKLRIAGDGPLRPLVEAKIARHGLGERVHFEGFLTHDRVIPLLGECDVALFLSTAESTSLAALECMAMGVIVVCSNAGAFPQFVRNGETGFVVELFPPGISNYQAPDQLEDRQTQRIADTLLHLQAMPAAEWRRITEQARQYVCDHYDWGVITARTVAEAYRPLLP